VTRLNRCQEVDVRRVEPLVEREVLAALSREELELAVGALERLAARAGELDGTWQRRLEAARYEVERAARRYRQVEPEHRLVARTLEREWDAQLEELDRLEREYERVRQQAPFVLDVAQRAKILALAEDLPALWQAPTTRRSQRKQILRLLIEDVTLTRRDEPRCIEVAIRGLEFRWRAPGQCALLQSEASAGRAQSGSGERLAITGAVALGIEDCCHLRVDVIDVQLSHPSDHLGRGGLRMHERPRGAMLRHHAALPGDRGGKGARQVPAGACATGGRGAAAGPSRRGRAARWPDRGRGPDSRWREAPRKA
jgi:hypothetical protein